MSKIIVKEEWKQLNGKYKCPYCGREYSKKGIGTHIWRSHGDGKDWSGNNDGYVNRRTAWNKGLRKETNKVVKQYAETLKHNNNIGLYNSYGHSHSDETKKKISESMKKAHTEGRAHNIGQSRWNNEPSWPENFFMQVIENEFDDKSYEYEKPFHKFSLDFVWEHKKKVIEIDGEQHQRFGDQKRRDIAKDKLLKKEGYEILRIEWKEMFNNTKLYIKIAKDFIEK